MRNARLVTIALTGALLITASATYAQTSPFSIDGIVTDTQNSKSPTGAAQKVGDPSGASKELGPKNGSPQQLGDIHTATIPMLADTNPNSNNDLNAVWTQTEQTGDGHTWLYYGWSRDTAGTGIIGIELEKKDATCNYANLLACNPWKNRSDGDVAFVWDTKGGATVIVKRIFREVNGAVVLPACPQSFPTVTSTECSVVSAATAKFSGDSLRGEAAIDLTAEGIVPLNQCTTFSNIIPFSGTGNSDSADIKDAVLNDFPPITNCGVVKVMKVLLNLTSLTGTFDYKVNRASGEVRPGETQVTGTLTKHNEEHEIVDLTPGTNYKLDETAISSPFVKVRIFCTLGTTTYTLFDSTPADNVAAFPVQAGLTTYCTIENKAVGSPGGSTLQAGRLNDSLNLSNVLAHAALAGTASFSLWTGQGCTGTQVGSTITTDVSFVSATDGQLTTGIASTLNVNNGLGIGVPGSGTYYWKVEYSGDSINAAKSFCTENTVITFTD
jgi:hypothetical protein